MITIWVGKPRQGKTLHAVRNILPQMRMGRRIISNTPIWYAFPCQKCGSRDHSKPTPEQYLARFPLSCLRCKSMLITRYAEFYDDGEQYEWEALQATSALVFNDEMSLYFTSIRWHKLSLDWFAKFRQAGKMTCDFYGTSQRHNDVASSIRGMVETWYDCHKAHLWGINWDWRREVWVQKEQRTAWVGWHFSLPIIYNELRVRYSYFTTTSAKTRYRSILGKDTLYPSEYRRLYVKYDTTKQITSSAMGKLHVFGKKTTMIRKRSTNPPLTEFEQTKGIPIITNGIKA
jgi:hypothetical protein